MKWGMVFFLSLFAGCAWLRPAPVVSEHASEVPAWAYAPAEGCDESRELCASGEGPTSRQAEANALKGLAAIFETRVTSTTDSLSTMAQNASFRQSQETAAVAVKEEVDQTLEAASITKRHQRKGFHYALAALDKHKASSNLRAAIERAQAELEGLWKRRQRAGWARLWELLLTREALDDRHQLVTGRRLELQPRPLELQKWYQSRAVTRAIGWDSDLPDTWGGPVKGRLTEAGIALRPATSGARVRARLEAKPGHLKVSGFEKWEFTLLLEHLDADGGKRGVLAARESATGRSRADCETKARPALLKAVETGLPQLNLED